VPDHPIVVSLIKGTAIRGDINRLGVVVEHLPNWAETSGAPPSSGLPNHPIIVQLIELRPGRGDLYGLRVVVEHLPAGAGIPAARRSGIIPARDIGDHTRVARAEALVSLLRLLSRF
jgi:hypothetical protein